MAMTPLGHSFRNRRILIILFSPTASLSPVILGIAISVMSRSESDGLERHSSKASILLVRTVTAYPIRSNIWLTILAIGASSSTAIN